MIGRSRRTGELSGVTRTTIGLLLGLGTAGVAGGCGFMDNGQKPTNWPSYDANTGPQANHTPSPSPSPVEALPPPAGNASAPPFYSPSPTPSFRVQDGRLVWPAHDQPSTDRVQAGQRLTLDPTTCGTPTQAVARHEISNEPPNQHHYDILVVTDGRQPGDCNQDGTVPVYSEPSTKSALVRTVLRGTAIQVAGGYNPKTGDNDSGYTNAQTVCSPEGDTSLWAYVDLPLGNGQTGWVNFGQIGYPQQGAFENYSHPETTNVPSGTPDPHGTDPATCG